MGHRVSCVVIVSLLTGAGVARGQRVVTLKRPASAGAAVAGILSSDFPVTISAVRYGGIQKLRDLDNARSPEVAFHEVRIFWSIPESTCLGRSIRGHFDTFIELTLPDGTKRTAKPPLDADADCDAGSCMSRARVGGQPGDPPPTRFRVEIRAGVSFGLHGAGVRFEPAPPPAPAVINIPPGSVPNDFQVTISDVRFVRVQPAGAELRVFWKLPAMTCLSRPIEFSGTVQGSLTFPPGSGQRTVAASQPVNAAVECANGSCFTALRVAVPASVNPTRREGFVSIDARVAATGFGQLTGSF